MARDAREWWRYSSGTSLEDVPSRRERGRARTRVTHAALTFPGSPETDTTVTSILRQAAIRGSGECQAAKKGGRVDGGRGPNPAVVVCFFSRRRTGRGSTGGGRDADLNLWGSFPRRDTAFLAAPVK